MSGQPSHPVDGAPDAAAPPCATQPDASPANSARTGSGRIAGSGAGNAAPGDAAPGDATSGNTAPGEDRLTLAEIERLVDRFYDRVQRDPVLGPIFNPAVHDWDEHKRTLVKFWSSVALRSGTYRGNPMAAHRPHPIRTAHFEHWLALWRETANEVLSPAHAALFGDYAARIARSLRYGLGLD